MVCILVQILGYIGAAVIPNELVLLKLPVGLALLAAGVAGLVFVVLLSMQVYGTGLGILFGILTVFPCLGLDEQMEAIRTWVRRDRPLGRETWARRTAARLGLESDASRPRPPTHYTRYSEMAPSHLPNSFLTTSPR
jgi:hypothetical protein